MPADLQSAPFGHSGTDPGSEHASACAAAPTTRQTGRAAGHQARPPSITTGSVAPERRPRRLTSAVDAAATRGSPTSSAGIGGLAAVAQTDHYSVVHRHAIVTARRRPLSAPGSVTLGPMPSFDVVSEIDMQEVRNAVDQASREVANRFDFKGTNSSVELGDGAITLHTVSEDRLNALRQVLEEKLVKRKVSLKALDYQKVEEASGGTARQQVSLVAGISRDKATTINKFIKGLGLKGVQSQVQGDQLRISGKKRDDLQAAIQAMREEDFGIPLQFSNFRD